MSGGPWHPVAACGTGAGGLLKDYLLETWSPGGLEPGDLETRMMRMGKLTNDGKDELEETSKSSSLGLLGG